LVQTNHLKRFRGEAGGKPSCDMKRTRGGNGIKCKSKKKCKWGGKKVPLKRWVKRGKEGEKV